MHEQGVRRAVGLVLRAGSAASLSDAGLLQEFVRNRSAEAFAEMVRRHGSLVFSVCRRVLGHEQDAEDAFQATFLVLSRKATAVRPTEPLGHWLYGVAYRTARKARSQRQRESERLAKLSAHLRPEAHEPATPIDWLGLLDQELNRLSERERLPIVLCDLMGRSRKEAAAELGLSEGTLSSRLARGRVRLRDRLQRRGVVPTITASGLVLQSCSAPAALIDSTVGLAAAVTKSAVADVAEGVIRSMTVHSRLKTISVVAAVVLLGGLGLWWRLSQAVPAVQPGTDAPRVAGKLPPDDKIELKNSEKDAEITFDDLMKGLQERRGRLKTGVFKAHGKMHAEEPESGTLEGDIDIHCAFDFVNDLVRFDEKRPVRVVSARGKTKGTWETKIHETKYAKSRTEVIGVNVKANWESIDGLVLEAHFYPVDSTEHTIGRPFDVRTLGMSLVDQFTRGEANFEKAVDRLLKTAPEWVTKEAEGIYHIIWQENTLREHLWINELQGFTPIRYEVQYLPDANESDRAVKTRESTEVSWTKIKDVWVPKACRLKGGIGSPRPLTLELAFDWGDVNEAFPDKQLSIADFNLPRFTYLVDHKTGQPIIMGEIGRKLRRSRTVPNSFGTVVNVDSKLGSITLNRTKNTQGTSEVIEQQFLIDAAATVTFADGRKTITGKEALAAGAIKEGDPVMFRVEESEIKILGLSIGVRQGIYDDLKPPEPTDQRVAAAKEAYAKHGAEYAEGSQKGQHTFTMPEKTTDADLKGLPDLPFRFDLSLGNTMVTDAGLKEIRELKNLDSLNLSRTKITDAGLKVLGDLPNLKSLDLVGTQVTGAGFKELKGFKNLAYLNLSHTAVTDAGMRELERCKELGNLTDLRLAGTQLTDKGVKELKELKNLTWLNLVGTQVTDKGLKDLKELKNLTFLDLGVTHVTDAGMKELKELKGLKHLDLRFTAVTDEGLEDLKDLNNLDWLVLVGTQVTDAGLKELKGLTALRRLVIDSSRVTTAGVAELKKALPMCNIIGVATKRPLPK